MSAFSATIILISLSYGNRGAHLYGGNLWRDGFSGRDDLVRFPAQAKVIYKIAYYAGDFLERR
jgi:hypothetical protein